MINAEIAKGMMSEQLYHAGLRSVNLQEREIIDAELARRGRRPEPEMEEAVVSFTRAEANAIYAALHRGDFNSRERAALLLRSKLGLTARAPVSLR